MPTETGNDRDAAWSQEQPIPDNSPTVNLSANRPRRRLPSRRAHLENNYSQVSWVVVVRNASRSSRHCAGVVLSGSMPVYSPR